MLVPQVAWRVGCGHSSLICELKSGAKATWGAGDFGGETFGGCIRFNVL